MTKRLKPGEARRQVVEGWIDRYGAMVYRTALAFYDDISRAQDAYVQTFVTAYRMYDGLCLIDDESLVVLSATIAACSHPASTEVHVADVSKPPGDSEEEAADDACTPCAPNSPWPSRVAVLAEPQRIALLSAVWTNSNWLPLTKVLLLPQRLIQQRVDEALQTLTGEDAESVTVEKVRTELDLVFTCVEVPDWLLTRASRQVKATMAQFDAERRHRGPRLWVYATLATTILGFGAVGFGMQREYGAPAVSSAPGPTTETAEGLPPPLQNLPGTLSAQFRLPDNFSISNLDHLAIGKDALYLPTLQQSSDSWPVIQLEACKFAESGQLLTDAKKPVANVEIAPPSVSSSAKEKVPNWTIRDWQVQVGDPWAIVLVHWGESADKSTSVTQIYALHMPTAQSGLVKTIGPQKQPSGNVTAAGDNKIVVQQSVPGKSTSDANSVIGLPVDVYTLTGTQPLRALTGPAEIAAPFGLMVHPVITGGTLTFQGIAGQPDDASSSNATWYTLSLDGQLSRYAGPPLDGRPHWAVRGSSGKLWWCETTPDASNADHLQVLMSPMVDETAAQQVAAVTLSQSVSFFTVSGQSVAWVQTTRNVSQLVVEAIQ